MDIRANLSESVVLKPLERKLIPTGLYISLPEGYEARCVRVAAGFKAWDNPAEYAGYDRRRLSGGDRYHSRESIFRAFYGE